MKVTLSRFLKHGKKGFIFLFKKEPILLKKARRLLQSKVQEILLVSQKVLKQLQGIPAKLSVWDVFLLGRELREALITALQDPAAYEAFLSEL